MNGNPSRVNIKQLCGRIRRWCYNLIPAESKFKNRMLDHQDKYMMKAQVHVSKSSAISNEQAFPQRKYLLLSSGKANVEGEIVSKAFKDLEHKGGDTGIARRHEIQG
nr:hypothetical protein [Tanacetum cinerariifolium]